MNTVMSRKELMETLNISRTHLIRKLKEKGVEPYDGGVYTQKKLYAVEDVEKAFGIKINKEEREVETADKKDTKNFLDEIGDILKEEK